MPIAWISLLLHSSRCLSHGFSFYRIIPDAYRMDFLSIPSIQIPIAWIFLLSHPSTYLSHGSSLYRIHPDAYRMDLPFIAFIPLPIARIFLLSHRFHPYYSKHKKNHRLIQKQWFNLIMYGLLLSKASADEPKSHIQYH